MNKEHYWKKLISLYCVIKLKVHSFYTGSVNLLNELN